MRRCTNMGGVHKTPGKEMFVPKDAGIIPTSLRLIEDGRETTQIFQSSRRILNDSWRMCGNNIERTNRRNEFWTGTTKFKVMSSGSTADKLSGREDVEHHASIKWSLVMCTNSRGMKCTPLRDMLIAQNSAKTCSEGPLQLGHQDHTPPGWRTNDSVQVYEISH